MRREWPALFKHCNAVPVYQKAVRGNTMKTPFRELLSIDTLILAAAGIWMVSVIFNLIS
jgi:hypothetical protein